MSLRKCFCMRRVAGVLTLILFAIFSALGYYAVVGYVERRERDLRSCELSEILNAVLRDEEGRLLVPTAEINKHLGDALKDYGKTMAELENVRLLSPFLKFFTQGRDVYFVLADSLGYGGWVRVAASFVEEPETGLRLQRLCVVNASSETEGIGQKLLDPSFPERFAGLTQEALEKGIKLDLEEMPPSYDPEEAKKEGFVLVADIMSYATVSAKAVSRAVNAMYDFLKQHR